ncbi:trihelix transcription factor GT-3a, partial [Austrofundulus limnaeus]|uniref:Trihelix transcription factor GT-3a n=1 Tax=Austrofundulus limnaeus TaxID=52670 RepID=A0A2I4C3W3_AUSLI
MLKTMSRGQTWNNEETLCLLDIWTDEHITNLLEKTHKNAVVFSMFSEKMKERGFKRSPEQCRIKVKKLRQSYQKARDALDKSGSSGEEKDKCPWFGELDKILGTRPTVCPVDIIETNTPLADNTSSGNTSSENTSSENTSFESTPSPPTTSNSVEVENNDEETEEPSDDTGDREGSSASLSGDGANGTTKERLTVRGVQARKHLGRKRKAEASKSDSGLQDFVLQQTKQLQQMLEAEQNRQKQENVVLENLIKAHQEAEEKRFQMMQAQHQAHTQMVSQIMGTVVNLMSFSSQTQNNSTQQTHYYPSQPSSSTHWLPPASGSTSSSTVSFLQSPQQNTQSIQAPTFNAEEN